MDMIDDNHDGVAHNYLFLSLCLPADVLIFDLQWCHENHQNCLRFYYYLVIFPHSCLKNFP